MKKIKTKIKRLILHLFLLTYSLTRLLTILCYGSATGGQPGQFLQWAAGARSLGMGKAFFSISDDASATYWNPAGLVQLDRKEVMALHTNLWAGTNYDLFLLSILQQDMVFLEQILPVFSRTDLNL